MTTLHQKEKRDIKNYEAERSVIGNLLMNKELGKEICNIKKSHFFDQRHILLFGAIKEIYAKRLPIDPVSVSNHLKDNNLLKRIGGRSYLTEMVSDQHFTCEFESALAIVKEKYFYRNTLDLLSDKINKLSYRKYKCIHEEINSLSIGLSEISREGEKEYTNIKDIFGAYNKEQNEFLVREAEGERYLGIPSGFVSLDKAIEGLRKEFIITISAGTSVGKTSFMMNIINHLLLDDRSVCVFSLEMSKVDLLGKLLGCRMEICPTTIMKGASDPDLVRELIACEKELSENKLEIYTELSEVDEIILAMRNEKIKNKTDVFFIDYLQNLTDLKSPNEYSLITNAVKKLQKAARDLKVTLINISQVSNETGKSGSIFDINGKGSGAIKAASDVFIFLKRDGDDDIITHLIRENQPIPLTCIVVKARQGRVGAFDLSMVSDTGKITEIKNYQYETTTN